MTESGTGWCVLDGVTTAWFDAPSPVAGAALARRVTQLVPGALVDLRANGLRVRLESDTHAEAVASAARELDLPARSTGLQQMGVVVGSGDPVAVQHFWRDVLGYALTEGGALVDPLRRDPALRVRQSSESRPLRNRIHLDVVRPASVVEQVQPGAPSGPWGVCHRDPDGNEVDLVPGEALAEKAPTADWQSVWSAMACYRVTSPEQQGDLTRAVAELADGAGFPILVDLRPGLVIVDSGKDQWDQDAHGLAVDFTELAARVQTAARDLGATADLTLPRVVQLFLDAADVAAVRAFWLAALGYTEDRRAGVTDIVDPRRLDPVLVFQQIDASDTDRRQQRNRIHVEIAVPPDDAPTRLDAAIGAGGRLLEESTGRWRVADPEGNELVIVGGQAALPLQGATGRGRVG